jgi:hypothetical protein
MLARSRIAQKIIKTFIPKFTRAKLNPRLNSAQLIIKTFIPKFTRAKLSL